MSSRAELLLMYQAGYLQAQEDMANAIKNIQPAKKPSKNEHETISTIQPKMSCSLGEQTKEVEEDAIRKKYRTKQ